MNWLELEDTVLRDRDLAAFMYELDNCYFEDTVMIDQIDHYTKEHVDDEVIKEYEQIGCIIKNDNVYFPAKLPFRIKPSSKGDPMSYYIVRKGIEIGIYYPDEIEVHIDIKESGKKLIELTKELHTTINEAYRILQSVEKCFRVKIGE